MLSESSAWRDVENADRAVAQAEEAVRRVNEAQGRIAQLTGEGTSKDSLIHAVTDAEGGLVEITLDPRAMRLDSKGIAQGVTTAVKRAQAHARKQVQQLVSEALKDMDPLDATFVDDRVAQVAQDLNRLSRATTGKA
ncbi:YbaB/EbfC family nucleoid-associated protein [Nonomuraea rhizosphaerae]|uniref:YbaB/EbfC family nucleoid-associated protein n=1 Tax=Nonomuraea rhizosphaerae TaxID=2665663 RepID=UPI001C5E644F|nr:YbaB/EbfC family nucleoid-associated protein [Nonomuraea rhizosphaerae]